MKNLFKKDEVSVITSIISIKDGFVMVGSVKNENYKILILKANLKKELLWKKTYGVNHKDYEGQNILLTDDGYLICGASEGIASESGGSDWKAYLLKLNFSGEEQWEKSYRIKGNECAYSLIADEEIMLFGETSSSADQKHLFLMKVDKSGKKIWDKIFGNGDETTPGGLILDEKDYIIAGSLKMNGIWNLNILKVDRNGGILWEKNYNNANIFNLSKVKDGLVMTGMKHDNIYLIKVDLSGEILWDRTYERGCGVAIETSRDKLLIGGDIEKKESRLPIIYKINGNGNIEWKRKYDKEGSIEVIKQYQDGFILVLHIFGPKEYTEIIEVDKDGFILTGSK